MEDYIKKRIVMEAQELIQNDKTIREIAKISGVSKSTVHKDLKEKLNEVNKELKEKTDKIIKQHTETRHIKGGESTRNKYL